jgi:hypothetical protein
MGTEELPAAVAALASAEYIDEDGSGARWVSRTFTAAPGDLLATGEAGLAFGGAILMMRGAYRNSMRRSLRPIGLARRDQEALSPLTTPARPTVIAGRVPRSPPCAVPGSLVTDARGKNRTHERICGRGPGRTGGRRGDTHRGHDPGAAAAVAAGRRRHLVGRGGRTDRLWVSVDPNHNTVARLISTFAPEFVAHATTAEPAHLPDPAPDEQPRPPGRAPPRRVTRHLDPAELLRVAATLPASLPGRRRGARRAR